LKLISFTAITSLNDLERLVTVITGVIE